MVNQTENQNDADGAQEDVSEASSSEAAELNSLLKEYEGDTKTPDTKIPVDTTPKAEADAVPNAEIGKLAKALKPVVDYVNEEKAEKQE